MSLPNIAVWLLYVFYPQCTPLGRKHRIEHLMNEIHEIREVCAIVVYSRDAKRVPWSFTTAERHEAEELYKLLDSGRIRMPSERLQE